MALNFSHKSAVGSTYSKNTCLSKNGCPSDRCPDFTIRRHDTKPPLRISIEDCDGAMDFRGLVIEANMWAKARLKTKISETDTYFRLADDIGFEQIMVGDIIVFDRVRNPERMLVEGFDEINKLVKVQRGYHGTNPSPWKKGDGMRIFRVLNAPAEAEMVFEDVEKLTGGTEKDVLQETYLVYEWQPEDTCLPGCYWLEFKVLKMIEISWKLPGGHWVGETHTHTDDFFYTGTSHTDSSVKLSYNQIEDKYFLPTDTWTGQIHVHSDSNYYTGSSQDDGSVILSKDIDEPDPDTSYDETTLTNASITPSFTDSSLTASDFGCILGEGVEWVRRFPVYEQGFLVNIINSPTTEI